MVYFIQRVFEAMKKKTMKLVVWGILITCAVLLLASCATSSSSTPGAGEGIIPVAEGEQQTSPLVKVEEIVIALLVISAIVSMATQRLRIPYTVGLVLVGFALTFVGQIHLFTVPPEIILAILIPPLVFEAAFHLKFSDLRREIRLVLVLAIPGVILTTLMVGGILYISTPIALSYALVFGALIAATDPVSVVALFRTLGVPKRLQVIMEGESLLNDGTAIVLFNLMLAIALTGNFSLGASLGQFLLVAGGGILTGAVLGLVISQIIGRIDNYLVETTLTTVLAYGAYLIAEYVFGVSGVLAVVAAGLASGQIGHRGMSPTTRVVVFNFWEYVAFLANSFVFLIIGLQVDLQSLAENFVFILWGILAVLVARAVTVYAFSSLRRDISFKWKNILFWGGLRGAISLALALSLPVEIPIRAQLQAMAFGVVLFTLLVEGLTMQPLIKHLGIIPRGPAREEYRRARARSLSLRAAQNRLEQLKREGSLTEQTWRVLKPILDDRLGTAVDELRLILEAEPELQQGDALNAWREVLRAQRVALTNLFRDNIIPEDTYLDLVAEVDAQLVDPEEAWKVLRGTSDNPPDIE